MDIAIIGVGLYPFGRHAGVSAMEMGVTAVRRALDDAGVRWQDIHLACAGKMQKILNCSKTFRENACLNLPNGSRLPGVAWVPGLLS